MSEKFANLALSALDGAISNSQTTLTVVSAATFPTSGNFRIRVDSELMIVTNVTGAVFTVTRGAEGSTAASHSNGASVRHVLTVASLLLAIAQNATGGSSSGTTGQLQAANGSGGFSAVPLTYDGGSNVTADANILLRIKNAAGSGQWNAIIREGTGTGETLTINGDLAGDAGASAPNGELLGTRSAYLGINDASAFVEPISAAAGGVACVGLGPGLFIGSGASSAIGGGAAGFITLKTTTEPTGAPSSAQGTMLWTDKQATPTGQLLAAATIGGSGDIFPLSPLYVAAPFASDASRNLTTAESRATMLIASGTITAGRTLTNTAMRPTPNHQITVWNNCAFAVTYAFASGTGVAVSAGAGAIISGDGTNAKLIASLSSGGGVTWANDLSSSTNTAQYVSSLSGANGSGGVVNITGSTSLQWDVAATTPIINQATKASGNGAGMTIQAQSTSSGVGGSLDLKSGAGPSGAGNVNLSTGASLALQITAGSLVAGDIMSTGTGTVMQRVAKGSNFTFWGVNGSGVVGYNPVGTSFITPGTAGQMMTTTAGPVVTWGNSVSSLTTPYVTNSGADVYFGSDATGAANQAVNCRFYPSSALLLGISNTNYILCQSSSVVVRQSMFISGAVGGESALSTPFHWAAASITLSATTTASPSQYACPWLNCTNATTGNVLILPNTTASPFFVRVTGSAMVVKVAGQPGVTINANSRAIVVCNGTDYEQF